MVFEKIKSCVLRIPGWARFLTQCVLKYVCNKLVVEKFMKSKYNFKLCYNYSREFSESSILCEISVGLHSSITSACVDPF